jgi:hypothetical protein
LSPPVPTTPAKHGFDVLISLDPYGRGPSYACRKLTEALAHAKFHNDKEKAEM